MFIKNYLNKKLAHLFTSKTLKIQPDIVMLLILPYVYIMFLYLAPNIMSPLSTVCNACITNVLSVLYISSDDDISMLKFKMHLNKTCEPFFLNT